MNQFQKLNKWWNDGELFGYRAGYTMTHPIEFFRGCKNEIKWAWQRVFRLYDDRVIWSIDWHLAKMMPIWLNELKTRKVGVPMECFDDDAWDENYQIKPGKEEIAIERWNSVLDQIAEGFKAWIEMDEISWFDPKQKELKEKFNEGFKLFHEYFGNLWD